MSDNPFAKYAQPDVGGDNPFAKYRQQAAPQQQLGYHPSFWQEPISIEGVVNPLINFATGPARDLGARIGAAITSPPVDQASRAQFYNTMGRAREALALPENRTGQAVSSALSIPGQIVSKGAEALSRATIGPQATEAIAPVAGAVADVAPLAGARLAGARAAAPRPSALTPRPQAVAARNAGYFLPPEEIMAQPSQTARVLSGLSGKVKKQQSFSEINQENTNALARQAAGLPEGANLNKATFDNAKAETGKAYTELAKSVPRIALAADPSFQRAVARVGVQEGALEQYFPSASRNPEIVSLRQDLLRNVTAPTDVVRRQIAELRFKASQNMRKRDDAQAHQTGLAQRQAASVLEDAVERSIGYGENGVGAFARYNQAQKRLQHAEDVVAGKSREMAPGGIPSAKIGLAAARESLKQALGQVTPMAKAKAAELLQSYRAARQRFAKLYDIENATNLATGDVLARRIAGLRNLGHPLTGEMAQIADTFDAFPKQMQSPSSFGRSEDYSLLDIVGAGFALPHHPVAAAAILGRSPARAALASPTMQARMFNRPLPFTDPLRGALYGAAMTPPGQPGQPPSMMPARPIAPPPPPAPQRRYRDDNYIEPPPLRPSVTGP